MIRYTKKVLLPLLIAIWYFTAFSCNNADPNRLSPACSGNPWYTGTIGVPGDSVTQFLLLACATDFYHNQSAALQFRASYIGRRLTAAGDNMVLLSGQCRSENGEIRNEWIPFVTIRTSGYEQWLGAQAVSFTRDPTIRWDTVHDLSLSLQAKFDSLSNHH